MPLDEPIFDSRTYRDILNEAITRIPTHNPEWTNFNDSDPGITLLQLFSFMSESVIYRANLIPERNRKKFLRLLNIGMNGADSAAGLVTLNNAKGTPEALTIQNNQALTAGEIPFRTLSGLDVLPVNYRLYYKSPLAENRKSEIQELYAQLYASYDLPGTELDFYETKEFVLPVNGTALPSLDLSTQTVDGSLWIALLRRDVDTVEQTREALRGKTLTLGILPSMSELGKTLFPRRVSSINDGHSLIYEVPNIIGNTARYSRLTSRSTVDVLSEPGLVELTLPGFTAGDTAEAKQKLGYWDELDPLEAGVGNFPPSLADTRDQDKLVTWIRLRLPESGRSEESQASNATAAGAQNTGSQTTNASRQLRSLISWVGINAAKVSQRARVTAEQLSVGNGEPDQAARLINTPVILDSVQIRVNGELWQRIDDLDAAGSEVEVSAPRFSSDATGVARSAAKPVKVYVVDRESGEVQFGDGMRGMRPPQGANIQASYDYGGGRTGNLGIGAINRSATLPSALKVINPIPTWGGKDGETTREAEKRIPAVIRHRNRLVTKQDYLEIVSTAPGISLGRLEVLPNVHPELPLQDSQGNVTLLLIPSHDPVNPEAPKPDNIFLRTLCAYLEPRRVLTTELHLIGAQYKGLWVSLSIEVIPGFDTAPVIDEVRAKVKHFISPLTGGFEGKGWPLNKAVEAGEISAFISRVPGAAKVNQIFIGDSGGTLRGDLTVVGLQLPMLAGLDVVTGTAPTIEDLQSSSGSTTGNTEPSVQLMPVPVVPKEC